MPYLQPCTLPLGHDVLKISLVKISLKSSIALIWPVFSSGPFPSSMERTLPPPFTAITLQGYSAYVFPNLFQTWLWLRRLFVSLWSFSDWRLLKSDANHFTTLSAADCMKSRICLTQVTGRCLCHSNILNYQSFNGAHGTH